MPTIEEIQLELQKEVRELLKERGALMLAHNYERDEVQATADITGDSLYLSQVAAESEAEVIVFCGVHFMAESAAILAPEKKIILPRLDAGCPLADMITVDDVRREKAKRPGVPMVAYVNTTADIKAEVDICCTSANANSVIESLDSERVYMLPDKNIAHYVARTSSKKIEWWEGYCPTHEDLTVEEVKASMKAHPGAPFICHPECHPDIVDLADHVCSTSGMYEYARKSDAGTIILGTELGIRWRLKKENPEKRFIIPSRCLVCPNMKLIALEDIRDSLRDMTNIVTVPEDIRLKAKRSLDRMLAVPRD